MSIVTDLHWVARPNDQHNMRWWHLDGNTFETGHWTCAERTAQEAVRSGGRVLLHARQKDRAWHGGRIIRWRRSPHGRRLIFTYVLDPRVQNERSPTGWAREKAIVRRQLL